MNCPAVFIGVSERFWRADAATACSLSMAATTEKWRATTACGMPSAWQWHANDVPQWHAAYQWHATSRKWNVDRHSARQFGTAIDTPLFLGGVPFLMPFSKRKKLQTVMACIKPQARQVACHAGMHNFPWNVMLACSVLVAFHGTASCASHANDVPQAICMQWKHAACGTPRACQVQTSLEGS